MNANEIFKIRPTNEEQNDFIITIGEHLATEKKFKTRASAKQYIKTPKWDMILTMVAEMFNFYTDTENKKDKE